MFGDIYKEMPIHYCHGMAIKLIGLEAKRLPSSVNKYTSTTFPITCTRALPKSHSGRKSAHVAFTKE